MKRSGQISMTVAALLATTLILASSSVYLASVAFRPQAPNNLQDAVTANLHTFNVTNVSGGGNVASAQNSITVTGVGEATYTPDEGLIQVGIQTQNSTAEAATQTNAARTTSVIHALEAIGITNSSIETQGYNLYANYANCYSSCIPSIIGYSVTNTLQVNITSSNPSTLGLRVGQAIDTAVKAGANQINLYFGATSSTIAKADNQALVTAVAAADAKAQIIATSLGVSLTGVISASDQSTPYYPQPYYGVALQAGVAAVNTPIIPGTQSTTVSVLVVYSI